MTNSGAWVCWHASGMTARFTPRRTGVVLEARKKTNGNVNAEADSATSIVAKEYIWLPADAVARAPISEGVNRIAQESAGYAGTDLPVGVVDVAGTATPELLYVHADQVFSGAADSRSPTKCRRTIGARAGPSG